MRDEFSSSMFRKMYCFIRFISGNVIYSEKSKINLNGLEVFFSVISNAI